MDKNTLEIGEILESGVRRRKLVDRCLVLSLYFISLTWHARACPLLKNLVDARSNIYRVNHPGAQVCGERKKPVFERSRGQKDVGSMCDISYRI